MHCGYQMMLGLLGYQLKNEANFKSQGDYNRTFSASPDIVKEGKSTTI